MTKSKGHFKRYRGEDPESIFASEVQLLSDIYRGSDLPLWVIKKVCKLLIISIKARMVKGEHIRLSGFGAFVPYRVPKFLKAWKRDKTVSRLSYRFKISEVLREEIFSATERKEEPLSQEGESNANRD